MRYGSVCSGIEAASVAWHPLGWRASFLSEIEPFPRAVLQHHYPEVPLHGDFTTIEAGQYEPIDLLVGGTPCQSFSVAGLRGGLGDDRGNLALEYLRLADRLRPRWLVWENVPGVLSSNGGRDFGAILGGMVELGYGFAYRVLDAQYVRVGSFPRAVPQRRRRVFVVGYLGDWRPAAAVLFDRDSLSGHPAPRREAGQAVAALTASGAGTCGPDVNQAQAGHLIRHDVAHTLRGEGFDASEDGTGRGVPLVPLPFDTTQITSAENRSNPKPGDPCHPLASGDHAPAIAFSCKDHGGDALSGLSPTLRAMGSSGSHANAGGQVAVAFDLRGREGGSQFEGPHETANIRAASGGSSRSYIAQRYAVRRVTPLECERLQGFPDGYTAIPMARRNQAMEAQEMRDYMVRTGQVSAEGEAFFVSADGPRYKALGNSMAVNVMRWIGERIEMVERICADAA